MTDSHLRQKGVAIHLGNGRAAEAAPTGRSGEHANQHAAPVIVASAAPAAIAATGPGPPGPSRPADAADRILAET